MNSQVEVTPLIKEFANKVNGRDKELIKAICKAIHKEIKQVEIDEEEEKKIRWRRTADEILRDKFVVKGKACTDLTILFIAVAKAKGMKAKFVKLFSTRRKMLHSVTKTKTNKKDHYFDVSKCLFEEDTGQKTIFGEYKIYKIGSDSWSVGLRSAEDATGIKYFKK